MSDNAILVQRLNLVGTDEIVDAAECGAGWLVELIADAAVRITKLEVALKPFADIVANKQPNGKTYTLVRVDACDAALAALSTEIDTPETQRLVIDTDSSNQSITYGK